MWQSRPGPLLPAAPLKRTPLFARAAAAAAAVVCRRSTLITRDYFALQYVADAREAKNQQ